MTVSAELVLMKAALERQDAQLLELVRRIEEQLQQVGVQLAQSAWQGIARTACDIAFGNLRMGLARVAREFRDAEWETSRAIATLTDRVG